MGNMLGYTEKEKLRNAYIEGHMYNYYYTALQIILAPLRCP